MPAAIGTVTKLSDAVRDVGNQIGEDHTNVVDVVLSTDTSIYADGDVLADTQLVNAVTRGVDKNGILRSIVVVDKDDQKIAMDLIFFSANVSLGTENAAPSISDTNAANILGRVNIATGDYVDLGGVSVGFKAISDGMLIKPVTATDDIYVAAITRGGTPTYTAAGLTLRLGFSQD